MRQHRISISLIALTFLTISVALAFAAQDKYTVKVPGGLGFAEFRGYEDWPSVGPSQTDAQNVIRLILANPVMIQAYREGIPGNGKPFPDGCKIAKILWKPKQITEAPFSVVAPDTVPDVLKEVEFIEKDGKRFPDGHGWGYAAFNYDSTSGTFTPVTTADRPPQQNDVKCGVACHNLAADRDYIFTAYAQRGTVAVERNLQRKVGIQMLESAQSSGWVVTKPSRKSVAETVERLKSLIEVRGFTLFRVIDHSGQAKQVGLQMPEMKLVMFGKPSAGAAVMREVPLAGLDLPLKILVWEDGNGAVSVSYNSPGFMAEKYRLDGALRAPFDAIESMVEAVVGP